MEKRICKRITVDIEIRFYCWNMFFWKRLCYGTMKNLSENGMFIRTERTFFPCDAQIEIYIPSKDEVLYIPYNLISIIWRRILPDNSFDGIGVKFSNPPPKYLEFITSGLFLNSKTTPFPMVLMNKGMIK